MDELEKKAQELLEKGFAKNLTEAKALAEKMITEKAAEIVETVTKAFEAKLEEAEKKAATAVQEVTVKLDAEVKAREEAQTKMNRIQTEQRAKRVQTMQGAIADAIEQNAERVKNYSIELGKKSLELVVGAETKAVATMGVPAGSVPGDWQPAVGIQHEMLHLRNVIPVSPTSRDVIKYLQYTKKEGAIATVAAGALKPQLDYTVTPKEAPVRKIAGFVNVEDEFLEDIEGSRDFLMSELPQALLDVEDMQILKGDGTGTNLMGLYTAATALILPVSGVNTDSNAWDKLAAGLVQIRRAHRSATAIFVSPEDYLTLLINKASGSGEYDYPVLVSGAGTISVAGVPVIQHSALAANEAIAGDFARGTRIFQKMGAVIKLSNENANNFVTNVTTVLIEERLALPIFYTDAFVKYNLAVVTPV